MIQKTMQITGMTCAACAKRVEKAVGKLPGVRSASVNFATEKLAVTFEEGQADLPAIVAAVEKAGYGVVEEKRRKEVILPIAGMTCAACASRVEKVVGKLEGVEAAQVNLATEKAAIAYDPRVIKLSAIKQAIAKAGYTPLETEKKGAVDEDRLRKEREVRSLWRRFLLSAAFAVPLLYLAMGSMIWWLHFPIPKALNPMQYPLVYALAQLLLVIPSVIAGRRFYTVGYKALWRRAPTWIA